MHADRLIQRYIEDDPHRPGPMHARVVDRGVHVWALIGYLRAVGNRPSVVAEDYELPEDAVRAAIAYYKRNRAPIDAKLLANAAPPRKPSPAA